ncbi:MAG: regulatory protein RecX [Candidatus Omnitrophica bacterium]|nr:regulatory protein RecX [Candidatus Omnitrophota bacterium]
MNDSLKKALNYAFLLLKYRLRTIKELRGRLIKKKFPEAVIKEVIIYLKEHHYLDDREFAHVYTKEKLSQGFGQRRISFTLKRLGIPFDLIEVSLDEVKKEIDCRRILKELIDKLALKYKGKERKKEKTIRYLLQRGFNYDDISRCIEPGIEEKNYK